jgi:hypothetical protein
MARNSRLDDEAATELHNRLANQIVAQIVNEPIAAGDAKVLDLVVGRVKERLAKARLEDLEPKGNG